MFDAISDYSFFSTEIDLSLSHLPFVLCINRNPYDERFAEV